MHRRRSTYIFSFYIQSFQDWIFLPGGCVLSVRLSVCLSDCLSVQVNTFENTIFNRFWWKCTQIIFKKMKMTRFLFFSKLCFDDVITLILFCFPIGHSHGRDFLTIFFKLTTWLLLRMDLYGIANQRSTSLSSGQNDGWKNR